MIACPCCHGRESRLVCPARDRLFHTTNKRFELYECSNCGVVFLFPVPATRELARYYPRGYWWRTATRSGRTSFWHQALEAYRRLMIGGQVRRIERLAADFGARPVRLLDIGCGDGLLLAGCARLTSTCLGLDQSLDALGAARARGAIEAVQGHVDILPFVSGSADVITMVHVLEHLARPQECLHEVRRVLSPEGRLLVQVPNAASFQRHFFGRRWAGFDVPRHLVNYSPLNLRAALDAAGFSVLAISHFSLRDNPAIPVMSLFPWLYPPARRLVPANSQGARSYVNAAADLAYFSLVLLLTPLALLESLAGHGGTVVAIAKRR